MAATAKKLIWNFGSGRVCVRATAMPYKFLYFDRFFASGAVSLSLSSRRPSFGIVSSSQSLALDVF